MMGTLRHHNDEHFDPQSSITDVDVCMHAGFGLLREPEHRIHGCFG
jgi:hypothetical protein